MEEKQQDKGEGGSFHQVLEGRLVKQGSRQHHQRVEPTASLV